MTSFQEKVYAVVRNIPPGQTLTYKQVAEKMPYFKERKGWAVIFWAMHLYILCKQGFFVI